MPTFVAQGGLRSSTASPVLEEIELGVLPGRHAGSRAAVSSQTGLRDLRLGAGIAPRLAALPEAVEQRRLSRRYFWTCALCPISALAFGLGAFDGRMAARTGGRVLGMDQDDKWQALWLVAPASGLIWACVLFVVMFLAVSAAKGSL